MRQLITIILFLLASTLAGQNPNLDSVSYYVGEVVSLVQKDENKALEKLHLRAQNYLGRQSKWTDFLTQLNQKGDAYARSGNPAEALKLLQYAAKQYAAPYSDQMLTLAENYRLQGVAYYYLRRYPQAVKSYEKALSWVKNVPEEKTLIARLLRSIGLALYREGKIEKALAYYRDAYEIVLTVVPDSPQLVAVLTSLSNAYFSLNKFDSARQFASKSLDLKLQQGAGERSLSITRNSLANALRGLGKYDRAEAQYLEAIKGFDVALGKSNVFSAGIYNNLSELYHLMGVNHQALVYGEKALSIYQQTNGDNDPNTALVHENMGSYYLHSGLFDRAILSYERARSYYQSIADFSLERRTLLNLSAAFIGKKQYSAALTLLQPIDEAIQELDQNMQLAVKNNLAEIHIYLGKPEMALKSIAESEAWNYENAKKTSWREVLKAQVFLALGSADEAQRVVSKLLVTDRVDRKNLFEAFMLQYELLRLQGGSAREKLAVLTRADELLQKSRLESYDRQDKLSWTLQVGHLVSHGMSVCYEAYQETGDPFFIQRALEFSESGKARLLAESTHESNAKSFGGVPKKLIDKERLLRSKIAHFEREQSAAFGDSLFAYRDELLRLVQSYEVDYPAYHQLKFGEARPSIAEIQKHLGREVLISYIRTDASVYALVITSEQASLQELGSKSEIEKLIEAYYLSLQNQEPIKRFSKAAYALYESILQPLLPGFGGRRSLIVLPDPSMLHVPLEALLFQKPDQAEMDKGDFRLLAYLLNNYEVRYNYSAAIWMNTSEKGSLGDLKTNFAGFAPFSEGQPVELTDQRGGLSKLPASGVELSEIYNMVTQRGGKAEGYWSVQATINAFKKGVEGRNIIHIASHSFPDFNTGLQARIAFRPEKSLADTTDYLYASEVYALRMNADLVVLSSCESGAGRLYQGEGVFSLARSFHFAGARNVISSQWEVPDIHAKSLFIAFYQRLLMEPKQSFNHAFTSAKRSLIQSAKSPYYHPGYWSNFLLIGK